MPFVVKPDSEAGVLRVATQAPELPVGATEIAMCASGDIAPSDGPVETEGAVIATGKVVTLLFARATSQPVEGHYCLIEIYWREEIDSEYVYHLFAKTYLNEYEISCNAEFPASSCCLDGHEMVGDSSKDGRLVVIREVFGTETDQDVFVAIRGYHD